MTMESALEELIYLDHSYALQQSFQGNLCNSSDTGVIKKELEKKHADSGIGYQHLRQLFEKQGANKAFLPFSRIQQQHQGAHLFVAEYVALLTQFYSTKFSTILMEGYSKRRVTTAYSLISAVLHVVCFRMKGTCEPRLNAAHARLLLQKLADF